MNPEDAKWVFEAGRSFKGFPMRQWWNPGDGCVKKETVKEAWIRVVGLPLHLWTGEILRRIGDRCGGFLALNKETTLKTDLLWVRILVKLEGKERPNVIGLEGGSRSYELQIWWELPPWSTGVYPSKHCNEDAKQSREEEGEVSTRANQRSWLHKGKNYDGAQSC